MEYGQGASHTEGRVGGVRGSKYAVCFVCRASSHAVYVRNVCLHQGGKNLTKTPQSVSRVNVQI